MRFIIILLASSFLLLSVQPLFKQIQNSFTKTSQITSCCSKKQEKKSHNNKDCCNNGICNPFNNCICCLYVMHQSETNFKLISFKKDLFPVTETIILSSYITETFHPPNIV